MGFRRKVLERATAMAEVLREAPALIEALSALREFQYGREIGTATLLETVRAASTTIASLCDERNAAQARAERAEEAAADALGELARARGAVISLRDGVRSPQTRPLSSECPDVFDAPHAGDATAPERERRARAARRKSAPVAELPLVMAVDAAERRANRKQQRRAEIEGALTVSCPKCDATIDQVCRAESGRALPTPHGERFGLWRSYRQRSTAAQSSEVNNG